MVILYKEVYEIILVSQLQVVMLPVQKKWMNRERKHTQDALDCNRYNNINNFSHDTSDVNVDTVSPQLKTQDSFEEQWISFTEENKRKVAEALKKH